jgi:two-component system LytT family response regulator
MSKPEEATIMRVVIVDDEELARAVLREYLAGHADIEIAAECANGFEAVKAVTELRPDLLFLDVQMPKLDGFEVLDLIGHEVAVIFVTAYDEFALRAFEVHAVDYLLKPFSAERLAEALDHAREHLGPRDRQSVRSVVSAARPTEEPAERILVRDGSRVHVIAVDKLDYVQAQDDYVCLHAEGKQFLKEQTLAELETVLDRKCFVRIHRSYIVNIERLMRVEPCGKDSRVAFLRDGTRLPVSRSGYGRLGELL